MDLFVRLLLSIFLFMCSISYADAGSVAVFPFEDLSLGNNGVNLEFTSSIASQLREQKIIVISEHTVQSYMARNRIRWVGYLDSESILKANKEFAADYILFGTLLKKQPYSHLSLPSFGITLFLVSTHDAQTVWSYSKGISRSDVQNLLGIAEPKTEDELLALLVKDVFAAWPDTLDFANKQTTARAEIENVTLLPKFVQPGGIVKCTIRLRQSDFLESPEVLVKAGNKIYFAKENGNGRQYEVSWQGSDIVMARNLDTSFPEKRTSVQTSNYLSGTTSSISYAPGIIPAKNAAPSPFTQTHEAITEPEVYESIFPGAGEDGSYPVSLLLRWPDGKQKVVFLGTYYVDGSPPDLQLDLKGKSLNGFVTFSDQIMVLPHMKKPEPVSRWEIVVTDAAGEEVVNEDGKGKLPRRFTWTGVTGSGAPAVDGEYAISLRTWDRAENMAIASESVVLVKKKPEIVLQAKKNEGDLDLEFQYGGKIPLSFWSYELRSKDGLLVKQGDSEALPFAMEISQELLAESGPVGCFVHARDILGNLSKNKIADVVLLADQQTQTNAVVKKKAAGATEAWVEEF